MNDGQLLATMGTDAAVWAQQFCARFAVFTEEGVVLDAEGLMLGWFANAIEAGRDAGRAALATAEAERDTWKAYAARVAQEARDNFGVAEAAEDDEVELLRARLATAEAERERVIEKAKENQRQRFERYARALRDLLEASEEWEHIGLGDAQAAARALLAVPEGDAK